MPAFGAGGGGGGSDVGGGEVGGGGRDAGEVVKVVGVVAQGLAGFFPGSHGVAAAALSASNSPPPRSAASSPQHAALIGPEHSGKTSLLVAYALSILRSNQNNNNNISNISTRALYIRPAPVATDANPARHGACDVDVALPEGVDAADEGLARVDVRYLASDTELRKFFACFHLLRQLPCAVLIDDFSEFFAHNRQKEGVDARLPSQQEMAVAQTIACVRDAVDYANQRLRKDGLLCQLLVADTASRHKQYLFHRWLPTLYEIKGVSHGEFELSARAGSKQHVDCVVTYTMDEQHVRVERVHKR
eukprot:jgi/Chlat1/5462/Chrsp36S00419